MNKLCKIFGHKIPDGDGRAYGHVRALSVDGVGRHHMQLLMQCVRCNERYTAGKFHLWPAEITRLMSAGGTSEYLRLIKDTEMVIQMCEEAENDEKKQQEFLIDLETVLRPASAKRDGAYKLANLLRRLSWESQ